MYKKYGNKFYCFSPPVMLATFLIEFGLAIYVLWRYKATEISRLVVLILLMLGVFQLTEFMICGGLGLSHVEWARIGYVSITLLPALGIHLILAVSKLKMRPLLLAAYGTAALYIWYFAMMSDAVISKTCSANYAMFETHGLAGWLYVAFYYGWLLVALGLAAYAARKKPKLTVVMRWISLGYAAFIVPTSLANLIDPATIHAIPSIMCGFAVLLAIVLVWRVLPLAKVPAKRR